VTVEWSSYRLEDFLLFSPRTYFRLVEIHQEAIWPMQIPAVAIGIAVLLLAWSRRWSPAIPLLLSACWFFVAWAWFTQRYATINWAADYAAAAFAAEGLLLLLAGAGRGWRVSHGWGARIGLVLFLATLLLPPFLLPLEGRNWTQLELFGTMPDATAIGTLAMLASINGWWRWAMVPIPVFSCAISGATLAAMDSPSAWLVMLAAMGAVLLIVASRRLNASPPYHGA
jgi:hypothetical protein